jgi:hypothetical protein
MAELIQRGGPTLLLILALVLPALVMVILHVVLARAWSAWISTGLLALILAIGLYGTLTARSITNRALEAIVDDADRRECAGEGRGPRQRRARARGRDRRAAPATALLEPLIGISIAVEDRGDYSLRGHRR